MNPSISYVDEIKAAYAEVQKAETGALECAIECGGLLAAAKKALQQENEHKKKTHRITWHKWVQENCEIAESTANLYIRLSENRDLIKKKEAKSINAARAELPSERPPRNNDGDGDDDAADDDPDDDDADDDEESDSAIHRGAPDDRFANELPQLDVDEVYKLLTDNWDQEKIRALAERLAGYLTPLPDNAVISSRAPAAPPVVRRS